MRAPLSTRRVGVLGARPTTSRPVVWRAAISAAIVEVEAASSMWPCQPAGQAEQLRDPVAHHALELGRRRRGAPQDRHRVQRGGEHLGEDRRARAPTPRSRRSSAGAASASCRAAAPRRGRAARRRRARPPRAARPAAARGCRPARPGRAPAARRRARGSPPTHSSAARPSSRNARARRRHRRSLGLASSASRARAPRERRLGRAAQLGQQVAAARGGGHGALHQLRELGGAQLVEPRLRAVDRAPQRADPAGGARRRAASSVGWPAPNGEASHWRTRSTIASASPRGRPR